MNANLLTLVVSKPSFRGASRFFMPCVHPFLPQRHSLVQCGADFPPSRQRNQDVAADEGVIRGDIAPHVGYSLEGGGGAVLAVAAKRGFTLRRFGGRWRKSKSMTAV